VALRDEDVAIGANRDVVRLIQQACPRRLVPFASLTLGADRQQHLASRIQLHHRVRADVRCPEIAVAVDLQPVRTGEHAVAERADEPAVLVELEEGLRAARQHVDVPARVERHSCGSAHLRPLGQLDRVRHERVVELGGGFWNEQRRVGRPLRDKGHCQEQTGEGKRRFVSWIAPEGCDYNTWEQWHLAGV
jgi:hypothetical protein